MEIVEEEIGAGLDNMAEQLKIISRTDGIIAKIKDYSREAYEAGSAFATIKTPPIMLAEIIAGLKASEMFESRAFFCLTYIPAALAFNKVRKSGRDGIVKKTMKKFLPENVVNSKNFNKNYDRLCGVVGAGVAAGVGYAYYKFSGLHPDSYPILPSIVGGIVNFTSGGALGSAIDSNMDAAKREVYERSLFSNKKYFRMEPSIEAKKTITSRIKLVTWGTLAAGYLTTNYQQISQTLEQILR